jgi:seryl-tRNA synthetase
VIDPAEGGRFMADLVEAGLLVPTGVEGVIGRSGQFERVLLGFDAYVERTMAGDGAETVRFPPVLPREQLEKTGYLSSFPHLAGSVFSFAGNEAEAVDLAERAVEHADWSDLQSQTEVMLTPAACYPVYPWVAGAGPLPLGGRLIDVACQCFRHEPSSDPARMQSFRMHEQVRIATADEVVEWHRDWVDRGGEILGAVGLETDAVVASDPFFGRAGRMLSMSQREQGLKLERVFPITSDQPTPIMSINYHQDHFGRDFDIVTGSGDVAHTACIGFGLERVTLALFKHHGLDERSWPEDVRRLLGLPAES